MRKTDLSVLFTLPDDILKAAALGARTVLLFLIAFVFFERNPP